MLSLMRGPLGLRLSARGAAHVAAATPVHLGECVHDLGLLDARVGGVPQRKGEQVSPCLPARRAPLRLHHNAPPSPSRPGSAAIWTSAPPPSIRRPRHTSSASIWLSSA